MTAQLANGGHKIYPKIIFDSKQDTITAIKQKMKFMELLFLLELKIRNISLQEKLEQPKLKE